LKKFIDENSRRPLKFWQLLFVVYGILFRERQCRFPIWLIVAFCLRGFADSVDIFLHSSGVYIAENKKEKKFINNNNNNNNNKRGKRERETEHRKELTSLLSSRSFVFERLISLSILSISFSIKQISRS
jgi:hypothetical protein